MKEEENNHLTPTVGKLSDVEEEEEKEEEEEEEEEEEHKGSKDEYLRTWEESFGFREDAIKTKRN